MTSPCGLHFCPFLPECVKSVFIITFCWSSVFKMRVGFLLIVHMTAGAKGWNTATVETRLSDTMWLMDLHIYVFKQGSSTFEGSFTLWWYICIRAAQYIVSALTSVTLQVVQCQVRQIKSSMSCHNLFAAWYKRKTGTVLIFSWLIYKRSLSDIQHSLLWIKGIIHPNIWITWTL